MKEECIICKAPLIYLEKDEMMECVLCHKKELSKTRCEQGHYVCNECHTKGMGVIIDICLSETSKNPIEIIRRMMAQPFCHMHGPEHHVMVGSALLTAYKNAGGEIDLPEALLEMMIFLLRQNQLVFLHQLNLLTDFLHFHIKQYFYCFFLKNKLFLTQLLFFHLNQ